MTEIDNGEIHDTWKAKLDMAELGSVKYKINQKDPY